MRNITTILTKEFIDSLPNGWVALMVRIREMMLLGNNEKIKELVQKIIIFCYAANCSCCWRQIASNYWMALATPVSATAEPGIGSLTLMVVYVSLAIGSSFATLARAVFAVIAGYKTATILFNQMHLSFIRAPMSFLDATPSGRILNRASTDQSAVDMSIPNIAWGFTFNVVQVLGTVAVMSQVAWQVFIVLIPVMATCILYQRYYSASARELSRLTGICQAPVIQHFSETISGTTTIRSFEQESRFHEMNMQLIDKYSQPKLYSASAMEWLTFRLEDNQERLKIMEQHH